MFRNADVVKNRLLSLKNLTATSRDAIEDYYTHLKAEACTDNTIQNYLLQICYALEDIQKPLEDIRLQDVEQHVVRIMENVGPATVRLRKAALKLILKRMKGKDNPLADIKFKVTKAEKESLKKKHQRHLSRDDLKLLMENAVSNQVRIMFYFLYVSGLRVNELCLMNTDSIEFMDNGMKVHVSVMGKTGSRTVPIYEPQLVDDMKQYINNHPHRRNPKSPMWFSEKNVNHLGRINKGTVWQRIRYTKMRAGLNKPIYAHLFRHSRALELGSAFTDRQMMAYFGWESPSMCSVYCNHHKIDVGNTLAALSGVELEKRQVRQFQDMAERCPRCQKKNSTGLGVCPNCGQGLTRVAIEREKKTSIGNAVIELSKTNEELAEALAKALKARGF